MGRNKSMDKIETLNKYEGNNIKKNIPLPNKNNQNNKITTKIPTKR